MVTMTMMTMTITMAVTMNQRQPSLEDQGCQFWVYGVGEFGGTGPLGGKCSTTRCLRDDGDRLVVVRVLVRLVIAND